MFCKKCGASLLDEVKFCGKCGTPTDESNPQVVTNQLVLPASILRRLSNRIIDIFAIYILLIISYFFAFLFGAPSMAILGFIIYIIGYYVVCESIWGKTLGKVITNTKVVDREGNKPSFLRILGRSCARWIPFEIFSFLFGGFPVGWHDSLSKTFVVSDNLSAEDVKKIDIQVTKKQTHYNVIVIIVVIFFVVLLFVAILGIFSAIVLSSLSTARTKSADYQIKSSLSELRVEAEIYYGSNNDSYSGFCNDIKALNLLRSASKASNINEDSNYTCNDSKSNYVASAPLKNGGYWCVDDSGKESSIDNKITTQISCLNSQLPPSLSTTTSNF